MDVALFHTFPSTAHTLDDDDDDDSRYNVPSPLSFDSSRSKVTPTPARYCGTFDLELSIKRQHIVIITDDDDDADDADDDYDCL